MGLMTEGDPLSWPETKNLSNHVKKHGIIQFINLYRRVQNRQGDCLKWGDEVEYMLVKFDHEKKTARLTLKAKEVLDVLCQDEEKNPKTAKALWRPEYGAYMIEGVPGQPYGGLLAYFNVVEANMRYRREVVSALLQPGESLMSLTSFPRLGCEAFTEPILKPTPHSGLFRSLFFPDEAVYSGHPKFKALAFNIKQRRGSKVTINAPVFMDTNTPSPYVEILSKDGDDGTSQGLSLPNHVFMDATGFGMGCCCLQVTFQACDMKEARLLYDQLTPLSPIMLAITAASPFHRGMITDYDCRWKVIASSVDCRTRVERGFWPPIGCLQKRIPKSRYGSVETYLSPQGDQYNDMPLVIDEEAYTELRTAGIDHLLSQHIAHLFIRDTLCIFKEMVHQDDEKDTDHFENIQSSNWQALRFKPPPSPDGPIGWRVEFRPCEAQFTDFENAAIACFVVLLTRTILSFNLNLLIPISKVDENMHVAQFRDAINFQKFWFRNDITGNLSSPNDEEYSLMTIAQIFNGKEKGFPGLIPLVRSYLTSMDVDVDTHYTILQYLKLIERRASGELLTTASWLRKQVYNHPEYKQDSVISEKINYDLLCVIDDIQNRNRPCPDLLGESIISKTSDNIPEAIKKAENLSREQK